MKETELWARLLEHLGPGYYRVWASQHSVPGLESRTVTDAIESGVAFKEIWRAVWAELGLPDRDR
ncbi:MAG: DUF3046 domain-containing protein [Propionibacteriaceae bacterium]